MRQYLLTGALLMFNACATVPPGCISAVSAGPFTLAGTVQSRPFKDAVFFSTYHVSSIAPAESLTSDDAEGPVKVGIRLSDECRAGQRFIARLVPYGRLNRISGSGYYSDEYGSFVIDCICSVERLPDPTPEQIRRLMVP